MSNVSPNTKTDVIHLDARLRFLYADPTPSALQVFLRSPGEPVSISNGLPPEQGTEKGTWINADPIPGCVVCNIGESKCSYFHNNIHPEETYPISVGDLVEWAVQEYIASCHS